MSDKAKLLARKIAIAFGVGAGAVIVVQAPGLLDALTGQDWAEFKVLGWTLLIGALAGGLRALVALLFAFVPGDAADGVNLLGKFKGDGGAY